MSLQELRGLRPAAELAAVRSHGDRLRYLGGCRCTDCRRANSRYENERQKARRAGDWNGVVCATRARAHLRALSRAGIGRRAVELATDVASSIIFEIKNGTRQRIRARTERRILAVNKSAMCLGSLVSAIRTWKLIDELIDEGYTRSAIAHGLGFKGCGIQLSKDHVTLRNALRVQRLHHQLTT